MIAVQSELSPVIYPDLQDAGKRLIATYLTFPHAIAWYQEATSHAVRSRMDVAGCVVWAAEHKCEENQEQFNMLINDIPYSSKLKALILLNYNHNGICSDEFYFG